MLSILFLLSEIFLQRKCLFSGLVFIVSLHGEELLFFCVIQGRYCHLNGCCLFVCMSCGISRRIIALVFSTRLERKSAAVLTEPAKFANLKLDCHTLSFAFHSDGGNAFVWKNRVTDMLSVKLGATIWFLSSIVKPGKCLMKSWSVCFSPWLQDLIWDRDWVVVPCHSDWRRLTCPFAVVRYALRWLAGEMLGQKLLRGSVRGQEPVVRAGAEAAGAIFNEESSLTQGRS